jgi:hypothetical protein
LMRHHQEAGHDQVTLPLPTYQRRGCVGPHVRPGG